MKRICLVFLLMIVAASLVAQAGKAKHPLLRGIYMINLEGDTAEFETFKYDKLNRCVQIVSQTANDKYIKSFSYPDSRTVVVTTSNDISETVEFYSLNEAGQAITYNYIYQNAEKTDTVVSRIIHLSNGFAVKLEDYDYEISNKTDDELKLLGINPEEFITVSEGNVTIDMSGSVFEYHKNQRNTIGKHNQGIYYLGVDNKNPVVSVTELADEFSPGMYTGYNYYFDNQGRIIKQSFVLSDYWYNSFDYVDQ